VPTRMRGSPLAVCALLGASLAACAGSAARQAATSRSVAGFSQPPCALRVQYVGGSGGGQMLGAQFVITSQSTRPCVLNGYPAITLLDAQARPVRTRARRSGGFIRVRPGKVVIRRGRSATFDVLYDFHAPGGAPQCQPVVHAVRVRLPGLSRSSVVSVDRSSPDYRIFNPCSGMFDLSPVYSGG
jgi:hypothetical protein